MKDKNAVALGRKGGAAGKGSPARKAAAINAAKTRWAMRHTPWRPIKTFKRSDLVQVDLWFDVPSSLITMGFSDRFRVVDAWRDNGKWFHRHEGENKELNSAYITHWMPLPKAP